MQNKIDIPGTSITLEIVDKNITITNKIEYDMQMHFKNTDADASLDTSGDVFEPLYWLDIRVTPKTPTEYHTSLGVKKIPLVVFDELKELLKLGQVAFLYIEPNACIIKCRRFRC